jgi:uncharacterized protein
MSKMIFINLPVADLQKSMTFYENLGFTNNPQFTDETAACMVLSEAIFVMLLTHPKFAAFTNKPLPDSKGTTGALYAVATGSRAEVDSMMATAIAHGGSAYREPMDLGFMYNHAFADPDGHVWEPFHMDTSQFPQS